MVPVLPAVPVRKYCAVYNLRFDLFHGMEEVVVHRTNGKSLAVLMAIRLPTT
jgi:hypothetical protein